jgi:hypothetical protein
VDDIAAAALKSNDINWFFTRLSSKLDAKPLGEGVSVELYQEIYEKMGENGLADLS